MTEYKVIDGSRTAQAEEDQLNELAAHGWELVWVSAIATESTARFYLKRDS